MQPMKHLHISIRNLTDNFQTYQSFLRYLSFSDNVHLDTITLYGHDDGSFLDRDGGDHVRTVFPAVIREFLGAIQLNTNIRTLKLSGCANIPVDAFASFLQHSSIQRLEMGRDISFSGIRMIQNHYVVQPTTTTNVFDDDPDNELLTTSIFHPLRDAFSTQRTGFSILNLDVMMLPPKERYVDSILSCLHLNTTLHTLKLSLLLDRRLRPNKMPFNTLVQYISLTQSLQKLELESFGENFQYNGYIAKSNNEFLEAIFSALWNHSSIVQMSIERSGFDIDSEVFKKYIPRLVHMKSLRISCCDRFPTRIIPDYEDEFIYTVLSRNISIEEIDVNVSVRGEQSGINVLRDTRPKYKFLERFMNRNRGLQQFLQQYVPTFNQLMSTLTLHHFKDDGHGDVKMVHDHDDEYYDYGINEDDVDDEEVDDDDDDVDDTEDDVGHIDADVNDPEDNIDDSEDDVDDSADEVDVTEDDNDGREDYDEAMEMDQVHDDSIGDHDATKLEQLNDDDDGKDEAGKMEQSKHDRDIDDDEIYGDQFIDNNAGNYDTLKVDQFNDNDYGDDDYIDKDTDDQEISSCSSTNDKSNKETDNERSKPSSVANDSTNENMRTSTTIPLEVIPLIFSNHLSFVDYGPTIVYHLLTYLGNEIGSQTTTTKKAYTEFLFLVNAVD